MSWSKLNKEEPKTSYTSNATDTKGIAKDLDIVVSRMIENRERDNAMDAVQLLFIINSSGFIRISWMQSKPKKNLGDWFYSLELENCWNESKSGQAFQDACYYSIFSYVSKYLYNEDKQNPYDIYLKTDMNRLKRLIKRA